MLDALRISGILGAFLCLLAACGSGHVQTDLDIQQATSDTTFAYSNTATTRQSYTPFTSHSHIYAFDRGDVVEVYIGGDVGPRENLRHVATTENGIRYYMGASRDGVGVDRLENYEQDLLTTDGTDPFNRSKNGFKPFSKQPTLHVEAGLVDDENLDIFRVLIDSVRILNDILPPEFQIILSDTPATIDVASGSIAVFLGTPQQVQSACSSASAVACAVNDTIGNTTTRVVVAIPNDFDTSEYTFPRKVIVHELLHALGIQGHVDSIEFPDSIMGASGEYIPNLGHIISKIDREVLQILYMRQRSDIYNDWGEWSDTSFHLVGRTSNDALNFGVALFNGLPQPWVRGTLPNNALADNKGLFGTATWKGDLLGFSGPSPIAGDTELQVQLATLSGSSSEHDLRFRDIYFLNRRTQTGQTPRIGGSLPATSTTRSTSPATHSRMSQARDANRASSPGPSLAPSTSTWAEPSRELTWWPRSEGNASCSASAENTGARRGAPAAGVRAPGAGTAAGRRPVKRFSKPQIPNRSGIRRLRSGRRFCHTSCVCLDVKNDSESDSKLYV